MKTYVSYVIQDENGHKHLAEVVNSPGPPYNFLSDPQVSDVMIWSDKKKKELKPQQELVITSMYKI